MPIEALKRVLWRARKNGTIADIITNTELHKAVIKECGYDIRTYKRVRAALYKLKWIAKRSKNTVWLTGDDLSES